jgi:hypothetical protein
MTFLKQRVDANGEVAISITLSTTPQTGNIVYGIRFKYLSQGSGVASYTLPATNMTWLSPT